MKVNVLFFAATADAAGTRSINLDLPPGSSSRAAFARVLELYPGLGGRKLLYSVNEEFSDGREPLNDGDELAIFTAVSGG